jgi:hypothetical protein
VAVSWLYHVSVVAISWLILGFVWRILWWFRGNSLALSWQSFCVVVAVSWRYLRFCTRVVLYSCGVAAILCLCRGVVLAGSCRIHYGDVDMSRNCRGCVVSILLMSGSDCKNFPLCDISIFLQKIYYYPVRTLANICSVVRIWWRFRSCHSGFVMQSSGIVVIS